MQNTITYHNNLLCHLNEWLYNLNTKLLLNTDNKLFKRYVFEYPMFSDIFYLDKSVQYSLTFYNIELLKNTIHLMKQSEIKKIIKNCNKNIELLTYDILSLLNVYKHFSEDKYAIDYLKQVRR